MTIAYPTLTGEIAKRGLKKSDIATKIGISSRALHNKMTGKVPFTWPEVCAIERMFFPDMSKDELFSTDLEIRDSA